MKAVHEAKVPSEKSLIAPIRLVGPGPSLWSGGTSMARTVSGSGEAISPYMPMGIAPKASGARVCRTRRYRLWSLVAGLQHDARGGYAVGRETAEGACRGPGEIVLGRKGHFPQDKSHGVFAEGPAG
jgi:hypothetical protein